jgi:hypothetical protein
LGVVVVPGPTCIAVGVGKLGEPLGSGDGSATWTGGLIARATNPKQ